MTSKEARQLLFERVSSDQEFYRSLRRSDEGAEEDQDDNSDNSSDDGVVCYDEIDSSKTIDTAIADVIESTPADCLAEIYAYEGDRLLDESDTEDKGTGVNLDIYTGHEFSTCNATGEWMEWNSK